jgi:hypothetical protein
LRTGACAATQALQQRTMANAVVLAVAALAAKAHKLTVDGN